MAVLLISIVIIISIGIGMLIGSRIVTRNYAKKYIGVLIIDQSDPSEPPYTFGNYVRAPEDFKEQDFVVMKVENRNFVARD